MRKTVRLADIAEKCNVSTVTVSKALSDQKGVSEEMRKKIKRLAVEMGYKQQSSSEKGKEIKNSYNIGILVSERYLGKYDTFYWNMYQEITTRGVHRDCFTILEMLSEEDEQQENLPKLLSEKKVDGIIVMGVLKNEYLEYLNTKTSVPIVYLDFYDQNQECDAIISDSFYGAYRLTNYLFDLGHRRIGYVGSLFSTASITDRYFGYARSLMEHGVVQREDWIINDRDPSNGEVVGNHMLALPEEMPTAFVCNCDLSAAELIRVLEEKGYRVPEQISVVGFDNYVYPGLCKVAITTYEVDIKEMARRSISMLLKKIKGENYRKGIDVVGGRLIYKESARQYEA